MRITQAQFDAASDAAFDAANAGSGEALMTDCALLTFAAALGIEIEQAEWIWVPATIADARQGDVIRPAGSDSEAEVSAIGPAMTWNVDDVNGGQAAQFRPGEHPYVRTVRMITLVPLSGGPDLTPPHGMHTDFPIEIRTTEAEWFVIRALGGWANRVAVINHP